MIEFPDRGKLIEVVPHMHANLLVSLTGNAVV